MLSSTIRTYHHPPQHPFIRYACTRHMWHIVVLSIPVDPHPRHGTPSVWPTAQHPPSHAKAPPLWGESWVRLIGGGSQGRVERELCVLYLMDTSHARGRRALTIKKVRSEETHHHACRYGWACSYIYICAYEYRYVRLCCVLLYLCMHMYSNTYIYKQTNPPISWSYWNIYIHLLSYGPTLTYVQMYTSRYIDRDIYGVHLCVIMYMKNTCGESM